MKIIDNNLYWSKPILQTTEHRHEEDESLSQGHTAEKGAVPGFKSRLGWLMDRGAWWATVRGVAKSWTRLKRLTLSGWLKAFLSTLPTSVLLTDLLAASWVRGLTLILELFSLLWDPQPEGLGVFPRDGWWAPGGRSSVCVCVHRDGILLASFPDLGLYFLVQPGDPTSHSSSCITPLCILLSRWISLLGSWVLVGCFSAFAGASRGSDVSLESVLGRVAQLQGVSNPAMNTGGGRSRPIAEEGAALLSACWARRCPTPSHAACAPRPLPSLQRKPVPPPRVSCTTLARACMESSTQSCLTAPALPPSCRRWACPAGPVFNCVGAFKEHFFWCVLLSNFKKVKHICWRK